MKRYKNYYPANDLFYSPTHAILDITTNYQYVEKKTFKMYKYDQIVFYTPMEAIAFCALIIEQGKNWDFEGLNLEIHKDYADLCD